MTVVLAVAWVAKPGNEKIVHEILSQLGDLSRQEEGVITYTTRVNPEYASNGLISD